MRVSVPTNPNIHVHVSGTMLREGLDDDYHWEVEDATAVLVLHEGHAIRRGRDNAIVTDSMNNGMTYHLDAEDMDPDRVVYIRMPLLLVNPTAPSVVL